MNINLLQANTEYINNPDDFKMPYKLYGPVDLEVMLEKYNRLRKASYGYIVRLGIPAKSDAQW